MCNMHNYMVDIDNYMVFCLLGHFAHLTYFTKYKCCCREKTKNKAKTKLISALVEPPEND